MAKPVAASCTRVVDFPLQGVYHIKRNPKVSPVSYKRDETIEKVAVTFSSNAKGEKGRTASIEISREKYLPSEGSTVAEAVWEKIQFQFPAKKR